MNESKFSESIENNEGPDPVRRYEDGWYFWDEVWVAVYGPYDTETEARTALKEYCDVYLSSEGNND